MNILEQFDISGRLLQIEPLGHGNINDTYLATYELPCGTVRSFVHQRINPKVFRDPEIIINNMKAVTEHIQSKLAERRGTVPTLRLVPTRRGEDFVRSDDGAIWRTTNFLEGLTTFDTLMSASHGFQVGHCLGEFHRMVADLAPEKLGDPLPGFHHTEKYFQKFEAAAQSDSGRRVTAAEPETAALVEQLLRRRPLAYQLHGLIQRGQIPLRVVHNDPKINNFMSHPDTYETVCMIDLDTVKAGIVHYDFGDCLRSATNRLGEETLDFDAVAVDMDAFTSLVEGYCAAAGSTLTEVERAHLFDAVKIITYELSMRFLTSHLLQDGYFKERYPGNNVNRARVQFRLLEDLEAKEEILRALIKKSLPGVVPLEEPLTAPLPALRLAHAFS